MGSATRDSSCGIRSRTRPHDDEPRGCSGSGPRFLWDAVWRKVRLMGRGPGSAGRVSPVISGHAACATVPRSHVRWLGEPPPRRSDRVSPRRASGPPGLEARSGPARVRVRPRRPAPLPRVPRSRAGPYSGPRRDLRRTDRRCPAGIVRLIRLDPKNLQSRTIRLQVDATRPGRRLGLV